MRTERKERAGTAARRRGTPRGAPRYRRLAERLIGEIRSGRLRVGETMPGEIELGARFRVSRHTVREALRQLQELGLIERNQGSGTIITADAPTESYVQSMRSPAQLLQYPGDTRLELLGTRDIECDATLARELGCEVGARWFLMSGVRRLVAADRALCWSDVYVLPEYAEIASLIGKRREPVFEVLATHFGERVGRVRVDLRASALPVAQAAALGVVAGSPALDVIRRYTGNGGRIFEVSISSHPADRYTYSFEVQRGWQAGGGWRSSGE